ncbi:MAG TPA: 50S ribosomal protein L29 [Terracidiphilus sp.]|jgi:large subunit ribosomal protein L29|nr:50S ribosomal protein L29 [Terracidiphilus sp.]
MELAKIRSLSDDELLHHEKTSGEQLFRLRFQVSMGQNDGVKKLRQLRKEIAQIKTVSRERALGIRGAQHELVSTLPHGEEKKTAKTSAKKPAKAKSAKAKSGAKKKSVTKGPRSTAKKSAKKSAAGSAKKKGAGK